PTRVVMMLVRQDQRRDGFRGDVGGGEAAREYATWESRVDQDSCVARFNDRRIAAAAAAQQPGSHPDLISIPARVPPRVACALSLPTCARDVASAVPPPRRI